TRFTVSFILGKTYLKTKSKLSNQYEDFVRDFYICRNSLCKDLFDQRWSKLIKKYPSVRDYLMRTLYPVGKRGPVLLRQKHLPQEYKLLPASKVIITLLNVSYH